ncbi:cytochrome P450 [Lactarius vividus]|nr:cytochrome P450 [Lactarius vividus]
MLISLVTAIDCLALSTFLYVLFAFRDHRRRRGFLYPPGPPPWPVIGNLLDVPMLSPWLAYANMSKKYGQVVVVLCSPTAIKDLLEKRGELMDVDWMFPLARMGEYWHEGRKLLDRSLRPGATALHRHLIEEKTRVFLGQLLATPGGFRGHLSLLVPPQRHSITVDSHCSLQGKVVMRLTYGYDLKENDDMLTPPKRIVRRLPSWVPWFKYEPLASECRELARMMRNEPIDFVKNSMRKGTAVPSLATEYLQEADLLSGPESQSRVQGIKDILGSLYQEAISKELTRWHMVTPMGEGLSLSSIAQCTNISLEASPTRQLMTTSIRATLFQKVCAVVIADACMVAVEKVLRWIDRAILHDPELYPDPEAFNPDRFLNEDGTFRDDPMISLAFGAGRRICPGRHFADMLLFVVTASVLSVFNTTKAKDKDGNEIPVTPPPLESVLPDIAIWLPEFECCITPRDKAAEDLIRASASESV